MCRTAVHTQFILKHGVPYTNMWCKLCMVYHKVCLDCCVLIEGKELKTVMSSLNTGHSYFIFECSICKSIIRDKKIEELLGLI